MLEDLRCGLAAPWTSDVKFSPRACSSPVHGCWIRALAAPWRIALWADPDATLKDGMFLSLRQLGGQPLLSKPVGSANFFPAYYTLGEVLGSATLGGQGAIHAEAVAGKTV